MTVTLWVQPHLAGRYVAGIKCRSPGGLWGSIPRAVRDRPAAKCLRGGVGEGSRGVGEGEGSWGGGVSEQRLAGWWMVDGEARWTSRPGEASTTRH